eukprot:CAMPEP_0113504326 /NCGR_PEP_ID=MMETSP0014_2-20120614/34654_1 /TAXON_ID=2857 /ORGANISM="Nitzschia sp." /LENGTH=645 /DNA_ID=CAMNT_0000399425 /DNA_START=43 /DNA_END=1980 /DNA_ORIENTATION=+ /assembly_acc=CAM_ASM_000159
MRMNIFQMNLLFLLFVSIVAAIITGTVGGVETSSGHSSSNNNNFDGCTEIFVGGGWAGVYSFYRRVMMDSSDSDGDGDVDGDASNKCLFEASWRIGGRTYSVPINRTDGRTATEGEDDDKDDSVHFVQDIGAYRFSPDMHLVGDLILHQLKLDTECYQADCPSAQEDFPEPFMFNFSAPLRRIVSSDTRLPSGYSTALTTMISQAESKGARVFMQHKFVGFELSSNTDGSSGVGGKEKESVRLTFQDGQTGQNFTLPSSKSDIDVLVLNLPRNHLLEVEGVPSSLDSDTLKTLECIKFDVPAELFGDEMASEMEKRKAYTTTLEKAYLYYEKDAWWRTRLHQVEGTWPTDVGFFAVETPEGVRLNVRWHDGPVACSDGNQHDGQHHCQGLLETYYSVSNETFYSSLSTSPDEPLGVVWDTDGPEAVAVLQQAHRALVHSLSPLILSNSTSFVEEATTVTQLEELFPPPSALIVGVWRRPTLEHPFGQGYTAPTKVYYSPDQSGTPDIACQVEGLTETVYRDRALQPWRRFDDPHNKGGGIRDRIFLANNDYSCLEVKYFWGDWAEETLVQAERAMLLLGTPPPSWTQNFDYYTAEIIEKVYVEEWPGPLMTVGILVIIIAVLLAVFWKYYKGKKRQQTAEYTELP